jgi:hypothetical protein
MAKKTTHNVNGTTWSSFSKAGKVKKIDLSEEFPIRQRQYIISELYTMYDLKMLELEEFRNIAALLTAGSSDAVLGMMIVNKRKRDKRYRLYVKLNKRLPFARSIQLEKLTEDNKCPICSLRHKNVSKALKECPNTQHQGGFLSGEYPLFELIKSEPADDLFIAACRSIQELVKR